MTFEESLAAVRNKTADLHAGLFKNYERMQWPEFSSAIGLIKTGIWYKKDMSAHLTKPVNVDTLLKTLSEYMK